MKKCLLSLITAAVLALYPGQVQASPEVAGDTQIALATRHTQCGPDGPVVALLPFEVQRDFSKSIKELREMGAGSEVGLVRVRVFAQVDKTGCSVTVGYRDPMLYVARELRENQCAFRFVLEHEEKHVRLYQEALATLESRVRAATASGLDPFEAATREVLAVGSKHAEHDADVGTENRRACGGQIARVAQGR